MMPARAADPDGALAAALLALDPPDEDQAATRYDAAQAAWKRRLRPAERDAWLIIGLAGLAPFVRELTFARLQDVWEGVRGAGPFASGETRPVLIELLGPPGTEGIGALLLFAGLAAMGLLWRGRSALRGMERALAFVVVVLCAFQVAAAETVATLRTDVVVDRLIQGAVLGLVVWQGLRLVAWLRERFDRLEDQNLELGLALARLAESREPAERP